MVKQQDKPRRSPAPQAQATQPAYTNALTACVPTPGQAPVPSAEVPPVGPSAGGGGLIGGGGPITPSGGTPTAEIPASGGTLAAAPPPSAEVPIGSSPAGVSPSPIPFPSPSLSPSAPSPPLAALPLAEVPPGLPVPPLSGPPETGLLSPPGSTKLPVPSPPISQLPLQAPPGGVWLSPPAVCPGAAALPSCFGFVRDECCSGGGAVCVCAGLTSCQYGQVSWQGRLLDDGQNEQKSVYGRPAKCQGYEQWPQARFQAFNLRCSVLPLP